MLLHLKEFALAPGYTSNSGVDLIPSKYRASVAFFKTFTITISLMFLIIFMALCASPQ